MNKDKYNSDFLKSLPIGHKLRVVHSHGSKNLVRFVEKYANDIYNVQDGILSTNLNEEDTLIYLNEGKINSDWT